MRNTELNHRTLWFDGDSSFDPTKLLQLMNTYKVLYVDSITPEVKGYNRNVSAANELKVKEECRPIHTDWTIPEEYMSLDVVEYLMDKHIEMTRDMPEAEVELREYRLIEEIVAYKKLKLFDVLRVIIWLINTLTTHNIVWGVGRGSSVSSYALYVIGVHDVDSYAYDLDIDDFLHQ